MDMTNKHEKQHTNHRNQRHRLSKWMFNYKMVNLVKLHESDNRPNVF
jgi:hypothetical protein